MLDIVDDEFHILSVGFERAEGERYFGIRMIAVIGTTSVNIITFIASIRLLKIEDDIKLSEVVARYNLVAKFIDSAVLGADGAGK